MKLYPYSQVHSNKLKPLLIAARAMGTFSIVGALLTIVIATYLYIGSGPKTEVLASGVTVTLSGASVSASLFVLFYGLVASFFCLIVSGVLAAIVSIEDKLTES